VKKLKTEAALKRALRSKKYDPGLRQDTVEFARAAVAAGQTLTGSAVRLGMKPNTLHRWHQRVPKSKVPAVADFVEVAAVGSAAQLEVVWPTGHVIRVGAGDLKTVFMALEATCCPRE
jgi:hypothetical protein